ncbi:heme exporter protein CcmB [Neorickettsia sp. 179522]|uniref:heme exporter protein CcmB n=1 Tax=Neorickettsia sp. 179522 TaxID=1714371 RepID=UPI0009EF17E2|nr:heme exporter protein CcmB [Neorickettsia sp. 179522]
MFRGKSSIVLLAFLLINFFQLLLYRQILNCQMDGLVLWVTTNILHLVSVSGIFSQYWTTGSLEQLVTFTPSIKSFITKTVLELWIRQGLLLTFFATALFYLLITDKMCIQTIVSFAGSLCYSTAMLSFTGALCSSLSIRSDRIIPIILAAPISIPGIITALALFKWDINSPGIFTALFFVNVIIVSLFPLVMEIALRETLENL